jgi:hypothetical protein
MGEFTRHLSSQPFFPYLILVALFEAAGLGLQLAAYYSVIPGEAMFTGMMLEYFGIIFVPRMLHLYTGSRYTAYAATAGILIAGAILDSLIFAAKTNIAPLLAAYVYICGIILDALSRV